MVYLISLTSQGSLAVSRALGDIQLKEQGNKSLRGVLLPDPELSCFQPQAEDRFVIIATDGLWDVLTSQVGVRIT
jgi:serine/threonine protein phosphatase PrpC